MMRLVGLLVAALAVLTGCTPAATVGPVPSASGPPPASASAPASAGTPSVSAEPPRIAVGACTGPLDLSGTSMADVQLIACDQPHYFEAYATIPLTMAEHPGAAELAKLAGTACAAAFKKYVGVAPEYSRFTSASLTPDVAAWAVLAQRALTCLVGSPDGGLVGSAKGDTRIFPKKSQCTGPQDVPPASLRIIDCKAKHSYEVYADQRIDAASAPKGKALDKLIDSVCIAGFKRFVGVDPARSKYEYLYLIASEKLWTKVADHRIVCSAGLAKGGITGTLKGVKK